MLKDLHESIFAAWGYNRKKACFKIQNVTVRKDVTEYKNCALLFYVNSIK